VFKVTNISTNPLRLSSGQNLASRATVDLQEVTERERGFESRNWLRIIEVKSESESKTPPAQATDNGKGAKGENKQETEK
jgi:hypothetical protein